MFPCAKSSSAATSLATSSVLKAHLPRPVSVIGLLTAGNPKLNSEFRLIGRGGQGRGEGREGALALLLDAALGLVGSRRVFGVRRVLSGWQGLEAGLCLAVIVIPEKVLSTFIVRNLRSLRSLSVARTGTVSHTSTTSLGALGPSGPVGPGVGDALLDEALLGLEGRAGARVGVVGGVGAVSSSGLDAAGTTAMRARRPATPTGPSLRPCVACAHSLL